MKLKKFLFTFFSIGLFVFSAQAAEEGSNNVYKTNEQNSETKAGLFTYNSTRERELQQIPLLDFQGVRLRLPKDEIGGERVKTKETQQAQEQEKIKRDKGHYSVEKIGSGNLNFSPLYGHAPSFTVQFGSSHYAKILKHVGAIKVGEVKHVPKLPTLLEPSEKVWIVE